MQNRFNVAEDLGRSYAMQVFVNDDCISGVSFTKEMYNSADVDLLSANTFVKAEIKYRNNYIYEDGVIHTTSSTRCFDSAILEKVKLDGLIKAAEGKPIFYYMLFSNGIGFKWELSKMDLNCVHLDLCPKTTVGYNKEKVLKETYHLKFKEGEIFKFDVEKEKG